MPEVGMADVVHEAKELIADLRARGASDKVIGAGLLVALHAHHVNVAVEQMPPEAARIVAQVGAVLREGARLVAEVGAANR